MTPLRILHVAESSGVGGAQHAMELLLRGLSSRGYDVAAALPELAFGGPLVERLRAAGIPCFDIPMSRRYDTRSGRVIAELIRRHRFDIVHVHTPKAGMLVRRAARHAGAKVVMSIHGLGTRALLESLPLSPWERTKKSGLLSLERLSDSATNHFIFECEADLQRKLYPPEKSTLVYNGVDASQWKVSPVPRDRVVLFPARLSVQKDPATLLRAARILIDRGLSLKLILPSVGEEFSATAALVEQLNLTDDVEFIDPAEPFSECYRRCRLVVLTTHFEGQPFAVLDSMASGRPFIGTACGGIPETLGDTGFTVPGGDPATLARLMERLLFDDVLSDACARRARERVETHFTLDKMINGTAAVYAKL